MRRLEHICLKKILILKPMKLKKTLTISNFIEKTVFYLFIYKFSGNKKYLIKSLFHELKITLEQRLNKPLDKHYRQVFVYVIRLCVY